MFVLPGAGSQSWESHVFFVAIATLSDTPAPSIKP